ncbi:hypothetical protein JQ594_15625 [Bradyrhizobium manausense]|uniref:hypothetical protein n=1 Tax=Bradyrhizobium manausense TaxID=989370 RepID=UPI001BA8C91A|nr:hypothetical protein [Bradyrhizobium manausense]MBR0687361.1 hypothetical protein [Bradyrhizobium manausense]
MPQWLISLLTGGFNLILGTVGKTVTDIHADNTTRQKNEADAGNELASTSVRGATSVAQTRADVQKSQGAWGPFGLAAFVIAMAFAFHVVMIVLDSSSWHLVPTLKWYVLPWLEWQAHPVGSWGVAKLPGRFEDTEHEILKALFYVGPPSAGLLALAKAFQR